jgi:hypothetical protein
MAERISPRQPVLTPACRVSGHSNIIDFYSSITVQIDDPQTKLKIRATLAFGPERTPHAALWRRSPLDRDDFQVVVGVFWREGQRVTIALNGSPELLGGEADATGQRGQAIVLSSDQKADDVPRDRYQFCSCCHHEFNFGSSSSDQ